MNKNPEKTKLLIYDFDKTLTYRDTYLDMLIYLFQIRSGRIFVLCGLSLMLLPICVIYPLVVRLSGGRLVENLFVNLAMISLSLGIKPRPRAYISYLNLACKKLLSDPKQQPVLDQDLANRLKADLERDDALVIVMSGSHRFWIRRILDHYSISVPPDQIISSRYGFYRNFWLMHFRCIGRNKITAIRAYLARKKLQNICFDTCYFDSNSDLHLAQYFQTKVKIKHKVSGKTVK